MGMRKRNGESLVTIHASHLGTQILYLKKYIGYGNGNGIGNRNDGNTYNGNGERGTGNGERGTGNRELKYEIGMMAIGIMAIRNANREQESEWEWEQGTGNV